MRVPVRRKVNLLRREGGIISTDKMRLVVSDLAGERDGEPVFSGVSLAVGEGEALVVTGENGSGKSTLLRIIAGLLPAAAGKVVFEGGGEEWSGVQAAAHFLAHENAMKPALTVNENLVFWRDFMGNPHLEPQEALEMVGLSDIGHLPFGYLSTGQRRRASIAKLLVSYRPLWLLDEPTAGLDARSERQFTELMQAHLSDGGMIVAATHVALGLDGATEMRMGGLPSPLRGGSIREAERGGGDEE